MERNDRWVHLSFFFFFLYFKDSESLNVLQKLPPNNPSASTDLGARRERRRKTRQTEKRENGGDCAEQEWNAMHAG